MFSIFFQRWDGTCSWNLLSWKTRTRLSGVLSQQTNDVIVTSSLPRNNVVMWFWGNNDIIVLYACSDGGLMPGIARSQAISRYNIYLAVMEYSGFNTRMVNIPIFMYIFVYLYLMISIPHITFHWCTWKYIWLPHVVLPIICHEPSIRLARYDH